MDKRDADAFWKKQYDTDPEFKSRIDVERKWYSDISNALVKIEELEKRIKDLEEKLNVRI